VSGLLINGKMYNILTDQEKREAALIPTAPSLCKGKTSRSDIFHKTSSAVLYSSETAGVMDQISIKTPNPKCRLFLKIDQ
jgi:hypothetical protein